MFKSAGTMPKGSRPQGPTENQLLRCISAEEFARLRLTSQHAVLTLGEVVYEVGAFLDYIYFPTTCVVSWLYTARDGSTAEVAVAGNDAVVGVSLFLGRRSAPHQAVVQISGGALKMPASVLQDEFARGGQFHHTMLTMRKHSLFRSRRRRSVTDYIR